MPPAVQALLEKLEPMALMEENGLKKGMLALNILSEKARTDAVQAVEAQRTEHAAERARTEQAWQKLRADQEETIRSLEES